MYCTSLARGHVPWQDLVSVLLKHLVELAESKMYLALFHSIFQVSNLYLHCLGGQMCIVKRLRSVVQTAPWLVLRCCPNIFFFIN